MYDNFNFPSLIMGVEGELEISLCHWEYYEFSFTDMRLVLPSMTHKI